MKKKIALYAGIILAFVVLSFGFVPQVLSGKIVNQSDISGWKGMAQETIEWNDAHPDDKTAWTGSMFGGMPNVSFQTPVKGDYTQYLYNALLVFRRPASYFFISLLGAFLLMLALGISPLIAAGGAVAVTLCSYNMQIIQVGHNTKMQAIAFLPWVLAALVYCYRCAISSEKVGKWLPGTVLGAALFGLTLSFQVKANHPQISYYLAIMVLLFALVLFISIVSSKERRGALGRFFAASALLLVLGCVGLGTNATKLIPTWEYTAYSMRGGDNGGADKGKKGLDLDYATAWSYGWEELPNLLIPNFNGGSSAGAVNPDKSETCALLRQAGQSNVKEIAKALPMYWGPQPFTAGPMYMGAVTIFLFILGLLVYRGREKWWLVSATVLAVFLALGNHFMWFTELFYKYAPLYNKFRTVSMALVVLQFTLPMLAFLTLDRLVRDKSFSSVFRRKGWIALAITGGFCLVCALFPGVAGDFRAASDAGQPEILSDALAADRRSLLVADAFRSLVFILLSFILLWWGVTRSERNRGYLPMAAMGVCLLCLVDLWAVGKRYLNDDDFVSPRSFKAQFAQRPVDKMILEDKDPSYRVLDLTVSVFNDSHPSYWHKNIGGYSPAKLQSYQKYIENHLTSEINGIYAALKDAATVREAEEALPYMEGLSALNCRYIIVGEDNPPLRYRYARGNAWFEDAEGSIELTSYAPNELRYRFSSETGGKAVFSEVYYPVGWSASVDGSELPIYPSDEILRAVDLPAGEHELVMRFAPESYARGAAASGACSILMLLVVLASAAGAYVNRKKTANQ